MKMEVWGSDENEGGARMMRRGWVSTAPSTHKFTHPPVPLPLSCIYCSCAICILLSSSWYTQVMLTLILIDVQYVKNVVFNFEKDINSQNHPLSDSHHLIKKSTLQNFNILLDPITLFGKSCHLNIIKNAALTSTVLAAKGYWKSHVWHNWIIYFHPFPIITPFLLYWYKVTQQTSGVGLFVKFLIVTGSSHWAQLLTTLGLWPNFRSYMGSKPKLQIYFL